MKTKRRTKRSVVYHATPNQAWSFMAKAEVLNNKLRKGTITPEELKELATFNVDNGIMHGETISVEYDKKPEEKHPDFVTVSIWGKFTKKVTWEEYERDYKPKGF